MENDRWPEELNEIFTAYRAAAFVPEATPGFMPGLWNRIDQRQKVTYSFRRFASGFVTAAAALCLLMSVALSTSSQMAPSGSETYVEALAADIADVGLEQ